MTLDVPTPEAQETMDTLGVDLGIVNLATDSEGETFSGEQVEKNRQQHHALRQRLQQRNTKSAKRHLKKLSGKQAQFQKNTNHVISKRIVQKARNNHQAIAIEELRHLRSRTEARLRYSQRNRQSIWSFGQLRSFLSYKATLAGVHCIRLIHAIRLGRVAHVDTVPERTVSVRRHSSVKRMGIALTLIEMPPETLQRLLSCSILWNLS